MCCRCPTGTTGGRLADGQYHAGWLYKANPSVSPPARYKLETGLFWNTIHNAKVYLCPMDRPESSKFGERPQQISSYAMNGAVTGFMYRLEPPGGAGRKAGIAAIR